MKINTSLAASTVDDIQESKFSPAFNGTVLKRIWKRKSLRHLEPTFKIPPLEPLPTVAMEQSIPVQPLPWDEEVTLRIEEEEEEEEVIPPEEPVQFVFSESWQAARDCLRGDVPPSKMCKMETAGNVSKRNSATLVMKDEPLQDTSNESPQQNSHSFSSEELSLSDTKPMPPIDELKTDDNTLSNMADLERTHHISTSKPVNNFETVCEWQDSHYVMHLISYFHLSGSVGSCF